MWALTSPRAPRLSRASDTPLAVVFPTALRCIGFTVGQKNTDAVRRGGLPVFKGLKSSQTQDEESKQIRFHQAAQNEKVKVL